MWTGGFCRNKTRYTEEQIIGILKYEAGMKTSDLCREHGISAAKFYAWKAKHGGMDVSEAQRLKAMEGENRRLNLPVAELSFHGEALKGVIRKERLELAGLREAVAYAQAEPGLSERTACNLLGMERSSYRYEPRPDRNAAFAQGVGEAGPAEAALWLPAAARGVERCGHEVNGKRPIDCVWKSD